MLIDKKLGPYKIRREVGRGESSTVYEAVDTRIGRKVAVKVQSVPLNLLPEQREALKLRMQREARSIGRLSHPYVVKIYVVGEQDNLHYLVMEYLDGISLQQRLDSGPITPAEAANILDQVADGLEAVHAQGVVHRDIKPSNIMILPNGTVKLTDFGVAHGADDPSLTSHGMMVGSPLYMSPEQAKGAPATPASDLWSLGVLLYHMLSGKAPFTGETVPSVLYKIVHEEPAALPFVSEEMAAVLNQALDKNADRRFSSPRDLVRAFRATVPDQEIVEYAPVAPASVPASVLVPFGDQDRTLVPAQYEYTPRIFRPVAHKPKPYWQVAAVLSLLALGGSAFVLSQTGRQIAPVELSQRSSASDSLPESVASTPKPPVAASSTPMIGKKRDVTALTNRKPLQVATNRKTGPVVAASPKPKPVTILTAKVTPPFKAIPPEVVDHDSPRPDQAETEPWRLATIVDSKPVPPVTPTFHPAPKQDPEPIVTTAPIATPTPEPPRPVAQESAAPPRPVVDEEDEVPPLVLPKIDTSPVLDASAELHDLLKAWIAATNERDIEEQMNFYPSRMENYYRDKNVSQAAIRAEKERVFASATKVAMSIRDQQVTISPDGRSATMLFRKQYAIQGGPGARKGAVLQELRWRLFNDGWKIVSERDLRSYN